MSYSCGVHADNSRGCASLIGLGFGGAAGLCVLFVGLAADANLGDISIAATVTAIVIGYLAYYYEKKDADIYHFHQCSRRTADMADPSQAYLYRVLKYIVSCGGCRDS